VAEHPLIGACSDEEKAAVLDAVLTLHPEVAADAERLARAVLDGAGSDDIADEVIDALSPLDDAQRGARANGTAPPDPAELIDRALEPHLAAIERRIAAGLDDSAATIALGVLKGLYEYRDLEAHDPFENAEQVERLLAKHGIELAPEHYTTDMPDWSTDDPSTTEET
jgi:hypothetical protein